jgi:hypothetical protein
VYLRVSGGTVAERVRPEPGSREADRLAALAADPASGWQAAPAPGPHSDGPPQRPAQSAAKDAWLAYANSQDPADHSGMTKAQLIEQYGNAATDPDGDDTTEVSDHDPDE